MLTAAGTTAITGTDHNNSWKPKKANGSNNIGNSRGYSRGNGSIKGSNISRDASNSREVSSSRDTNNSRSTLLVKRLKHRLSLEDNYD